MWNREAEVRRLEPLDENRRAKARKRLKEQTRPAGSLGHLESFIERLTAIQKNERPFFSRKGILLFAADHGVTEEGVSAAAGGGSWGRPHVARAMIAVGAVQDVQEAFDRFLGFGRPAFVPKELPGVKEVTDLVRAVAGVTSAAHLKDRGVRPVLRELKKAGVDAVEVLHPSHDESAVRRIGSLAGELELLQTGGTDWHGDQPADRPNVPLGAMPVPDAWLEALETLHAARSRP